MLHSYTTTFQKTKLHGRAIPSFHLGGYENGICIVECLSSKKVLYSVRGTFDESSFPASGFQQSPREENFKSEFSL